MDYQKLFSHMSSEHGLILLESEMQDIVNICAEIISEQQQQEYEVKARESIEACGGCSVCGDLSGFECICRDDDEECSFCEMQNGRHAKGCPERENYFNS